MPLTDRLEYFGRGECQICRARIDFEIDSLRDRCECRQRNNGLHRAIMKEKAAS